MTTKVSTRLPISYEKLEAFCRKWNIVRLELFGSVLRDDFDPKLIVFVRRVRVRPTLVFQGRVEGESVTPKGGARQAAPVQQPASPPAKSASPQTNTPANPSTAQQPKKPQQPDTLMNRARSLWHKVFP